MLVRRILLGFIAGFLAVLTLHQSVIWLGGYTGLLPGGPRGWSVTPVPPFGIYQIFSLAFWGGVWGIPLALLSARLGRRLWAAIAIVLIFGAATTLVGWYVVGPLKGRAIEAITVQRALTGLVINGAFALGTLIFLRLFEGGGGEA